MLPFLLQTLKKIFRIFIYKIKNWSITAGYSELLYTVFISQEEEGFFSHYPTL